MSKLPSFQFYPADWQKDPGIRALNYHDRGVWFEILLIMFQSEERGVLTLNGKPMPEEALAIALGLDKQNLTTTLTTLLTYGVAYRRQSDGALYNKRMVNDEKLRKIRTEAGKQGGNPVLLNQNTTTQDNQNATTRVKQKTTPSSSSSSSSSKNKTFDCFWSVYPKKIAKAAALKAWLKINPQNGLVEQIVQAVEEQKKTEQWQRDNGKFIPYGATWLNQRRWEDEIGFQQKGDPGL